jgi:dipeptidyl aminopeptidase/acylaminoacyl peptidase
VIIDTVTRKRIDVTRTTGNESSPRWARGETHVTFVRDNNPLHRAGRKRRRRRVVQLTDVSRPAAPIRALTDSQKFIKEEEVKLLDWVEQEAARRKRREELDRARALPKFEIGERQNIADAAVIGDGRFALLVVNDRAQSRSAQVPRFVSESSFTEEIQARTFVGDAQDRRRIAALNLESGEAMWVGLDGASDPIAIPKPPFGDEPRPASKPDAGAEARRSLGQPDAVARRRVVGDVDPRGRQHRALAGGNRSREPARRRCSITSRTKRGCATEARAGCPTASACGSSPSTTGGCISTPWMPRPRPCKKQLTTGTFEIDNGRALTDGSTFYFRSTEVHPGERHVYAMSVDGGARTKITSQTGSHDGAISPDNTMFGLVSSSSNRPPEVFLMPNRAARRRRR